MKTVLITGADGFLGRNLRETLARRDDLQLRLIGSRDSVEQRDRSLREADTVFHLAGVNRPAAESEFETVNVGLTRHMCATLREAGRAPKIVFTSSIQAAGGGAYGASKLAAENELRRFAADTGAELAIYRLKNVFGKWCRPNYNSVVATFCHQIARQLPIQISDPAREVELVYVDDVVAALTSEMSPGASRGIARDMDCSRRVTLGRLSEMLSAFHASRQTLVMPDLSDAFSRQLYATFLSYLPQDDLGYPLVKRADDRGVLAEFIKSPHFGQIFVSRTRPGIERGNHYHLTKAEKFLVLDGEALIRLRHIEHDEVIVHRLSGRDLRVIDIPPGYTHAIQNVGDTEMIVLFWASEAFEPQRPDTHFSDVQRREEAHEDRHDRRHAA